MVRATRPLYASFFPLSTMRTIAIIAVMLLVDIHVFASSLQEPTPLPAYPEIDQENSQLIRRVTCNRIAGDPQPYC